MAAVDQRLADTQFERVLRERDLRTEFQPIVHLPSGDVVGYEALVRGPEGTALASAGSLLAAANRAGRLAEFDWAARSLACRAALEGGMDPDLLLLLNIEPIALDSDCAADLWPDIERGFKTFRIVLEVTERSLDRDPGTLLDGIERQRSNVVGIALDDVGTDPATVAMLPLVAPAIIKLDTPLVKSPPKDEIARTLNAVLGQVDRTGAIVLAEGIETEDHRRQAIAYGAQLGQGHLLGEAGPPPRGPRGHDRDVRPNRTQPTIVASPFEALAEPAIGPAGADLVAVMIHHVCGSADVLGPTLHLMLVGADRLDPSELDHLARLSSVGTFAAILGPGIAAEPGHGIRGTGLRHEPQPPGEWAAITIAPGHCIAIVARPSPDHPGSWEYGVIHDWPRAVAAVRSVVRLLGAPVPRYRFGE